MLFRSPVKPEILCNGSNVATNGEDYTNCMDFSLLTTSHKYLQHSFSTIWATSAATAQASWMAAELFAVYPGIWPETVRGLIVHSARWTEKMKHQFCKDDKKTTGRKELIRTCGYGIPNLNKAIQCMNNSVNMIIQDELQPFTKKENVYKMNEMNIHALPWPKNILEALGLQYFRYLFHQLKFLLQVLNVFHSSFLDIFLNVQHLNFVHQIDLMQLVQLFES